MIRWQGFVLVLAGVVLKACYDVVNKKMMSKKAPPDLLGVINFLVGGTLLLLASYFFLQPKIESWFAWPRGLFWPLIVTALFNVVIQFGNIRMMQYADASLVTPIGAAQPMIVVIPSMLILGEVPGFWGYLGLFTLAFGTYVLAVGEHVYETEDDKKAGREWKAPSWLGWAGSKARFFAPIQMLFRNRGVQIAFLSACCGAVSINFDKLAVLRSSGLFAPGCILLFCGLVGLPKVIHGREWKKVMPEHYVWLVINPLVFTVFIALMTLALYFGFAAYIGALKRTHALAVLVLAYFFLGEKEAMRRWPGALFMVLGAILLGL